MLPLLGVGALALAALALLVPRLWPWLLAGSACLTSSVALVVAGNGVPPYFVYLLILSGLVACQFPVGGFARWSRVPGERLMLGFLVWAVTITAVGPVVFRGLPILLPRGGIDEQMANPSPLDFNISNLAQAGYLGLGVVGVLILARIRHVPRNLPAVALGLPLALSLLKAAMGSAFPDTLFSNSPNVRYINYGADGTSRFCGILAEPADLGVRTLVGLVYFLSAAICQRGPRRWWNLAGAGLCAVIPFLTDSGTVLAGGLILCAAGGIALAYAAVRHNLVIPRVVPVVVLLGLAALSLLATTAAVRGPLQELSEFVLAKQASSSATNRAGSILFSLGVVADTWGLGVGLGSHRPSSFAAALPSTVGIPGALLFTATVVVMVRWAWREPVVRPTALTLVAFLLVKIVSGPNLSDPLIWLLLGVCAHAAARQWWRQRDSVEEGRIPAEARQPEPVAGPIAPAQPQPVVRRAMPIRYPARPRRALQ